MAKFSEKTVRLTLKRGKLRKIVCIPDGPDTPKIGDAVTIVGQGAEWTVHKVDMTEIVVNALIKSRS